MTPENEPTWVGLFGAAPGIDLTGEAANRDAVIDALTTHRHGEERKACRWCAAFYGDIYDRIKAVEASIGDAA